MAYEQFSYVYDRLMEDMPYEEWLEFAAGCWQKHGQPRTVVDLGCGTGSLSVPLAQLGLEVIGIDLSEDMLAIARDKADEAARREPAAKGGSLLLLQQDIREWSVGRQVDAVISFCDCFNYLLEPEELMSAFRHTYEALAPGGLFIFDMHTPYQLRSYAESQPFLMNEDDVAYIWTSEFDEERCEIEHALTVFVKEEGRQAGQGESRTWTGERFYRVDETHVQRAYSSELIETCLRKAGFAEVAAYADFTWMGLTEETERAFYVAMKPKPKEEPQT
ncbi:Methyltransferase domain-containing protein [Paenibacillus sp. UNCCL117]|uniref:class I SAM-dependent DNA methyltransferase n=1 Tax=unclassified Paenibacillus TaxID=185978 RepID=UPI0008856514|nr:MULTISPECIES: class I SAM-dependent methyltransferase [unclassified Paenibacillus]SDC68671.1 Methyltransferase domain-containing protein [Paenibacillus sp. cl123]SFW23685.1 Methyltransferase domain-containing protein [Paenibacillus sp. UNCCL117]